MKRVFTIAFILLSLRVFSQPMSYGKSTYDSTGQAETMVTPQLEITNVSAVSIEVVVNRIHKNLPPNWTQCFCYIQCNPPELDSLRFTLLPGEKADIGIGFGTDIIPGTGSVKLTVEAVGTSQKDTLNFSASTYAYVGLKENTISRSFTLFPNPVVSDLMFTSSLQENFILSVLDITGKKLDSFFVNGQKHHRINFETYPAGVYFVRVKYSSGKTDTRKVIKN